MPISRDEFEAGSLDLTVPIRQIFDANANFAFSAEEIAERLFEIVGRRSTEAEVAVLLDGLHAAGVLESNDLGGTRWYITIVNEERPTAPTET